MKQDVHLRFLKRAVDEEKEKYTKIIEQERTKKMDILRFISDYKNACDERRDAKTSYVLAEILKYATKTNH